LITVELVRVELSYVGEVSHQIYLT